MVLNLQLNMTSTDQRQRCEYNTIIMTTNKTITSIAMDFNRQYMQYSISRDTVHQEDSSSWNDL